MHICVHNKVFDFNCVPYGSTLYCEIFFTRCQKYRIYMEEYKVSRHLKSMVLQPEIMLEVYRAFVTFNLLSSSGRRACIHQWDFLRVNEEDINKTAHISYVFNTYLIIVLLLIIFRLALDMDHIPNRNFITIDKLILKCWSLTS